MSGSSDLSMYVNWSVTVSGVRETLTRIGVRELEDGISSWKIIELTELKHINFFGVNPSHRTNLTGDVDLKLFFIFEKVIVININHDIEVWDNGNVIVHKG